MPNSIILAALAWAASLTPTATIESYIYPATCTGSYLTQGDQGADLTHALRRPFRCDMVVLGLPSNGHVIVQFMEHGSSRVAPLGFAGDSVDYDMVPGLVAVPLNRVYLQHASNPTQTEAVSGIDGFCFLDGTLNLKIITSISCIAKVELGIDRLLYKVDAKISGAARSLTQ